MRRLLACAALLLAAAAGPPVPPAAQRQLAELAQAIDRYRDFAVAEREGWKRFGGDEPLMGEHWHHPLGPDYVGGQPIDLRRPSNLMYTEIGGRRVLTGVAFVVRLGDGEPLPEGFAGPADRWHVHDIPRAVEAATQDRPVLNWLANWWLDANYRRRGDHRGRLAMVHAWVTLPNPDGPFADHNRLVPYLKLGLPPAYAERASLAAARGLALAADGGCAAMIDGRLWIANAPRATARTLRAACAEAGAMVRPALASGPAEVNAAGERAWARFDAAWNAALTPAQRARIAAISEHGEHGQDPHAHHPAPEAARPPRAAPHRH